ncbi:MAG TPA: GGDEF domain-containing protein [Gemmataceae bacterium]|jgi:two-component system cell cycle response regulator|nr:GGDEF domain-containing protein [Gemmataceae bacterium]
MEKQVDTVVQRADRPPVSSHRESCLVHIYPTGPWMGMRHTLSDKPLFVGRGEDCDIRVLDTSVSRRHVRIEKIANDYYVLDMQSTNGTYVNDKASVAGDPIALRDGDYLRVGNCIFRYLASGNVEADYHEEIYRLTIVDALTQIANARYYNEFLEREVLRTVRHHRPLSLVFFDIDRFKEINDRLGHLGGDFTLREVAACVKKVVRREDLFARYGGEEFALILIETGLSDALQVAERIRTLVEKHPFRFDDKVFNLTISLGVAECPLDGTATPRELTRRADENLYAAKRAGRNKVVG